MIALLNPENGAPIKDVINVGKGGREYVHPVGETLLYDDAVAAVLLEKFGFLQETKLAKKADGKFKCAYCDYTNMYQVAVYTHMKSGHKDKERVKPVVVDELDLPVAEGRSVLSPEEEIRISRQDEWNELKDMQSGRKDTDNIEWYGDGLQKDDAKENE